MPTSTSPLSVFCPRCGASPGKRCMGMPLMAPYTNPAAADSYHAMRRVIAHKRDAEDAKQKRIAQEWLKP